ncbi:hypothetical protein MUCCIDRAFT_110921 [Mucor lusitanicus CBS 277.49]|uniref:Uncharacterized protein n=1 Tax=Mucor lusitanicus CBS 277.49 TaxID=747725 RepID=A0A168LWJ7_MUCCL|nr:hypothetical protein MUCCIDRAFT_110921 [Mucor lusitanicus CBS 277.49]
MLMRHAIIKAIRLQLNLLSSSTQELQVKKCLRAICTSSRNDPLARQQAEVLLNGLETITADNRVDEVFLPKQRQLAVESRVSEELIYMQYSTKYVFANLGNFNFLSFCRKYKDFLVDKEECVRTLTKCLQIIEASPRNHQSVRDQARALLDNIETTTADARVDDNDISEEQEETIPELSPDSNDIPVGEIMLHESEEFLLEQKRQATEWFLQAKRAYAESLAANPKEPPQQREERKRKPVLTLLGGVPIPGQSQQQPSETSSTAATDSHASSSSSSPTQKKQKF